MDDGDMDKKRGRAVAFESARALDQKSQIRDELNGLAQRIDAKLGGNVASEDPQEESNLIMARDKARRIANNATTRPLNDLLSEYKNFKQELVRMPIHKSILLQILGALGNLNEDDPPVS